MGNSASTGHRSARCQNRKILWCGVTSCVVEQIEECFPVEMCLAGFDWLKGEDVSQLHKDWVEEKKAICCNDEGQYEVSRLDVEAYPWKRAIFPTFQYP